MLLKKIFMTILILFIIITIYSIPISTLKNKKVLRTNLEIENISIPTTKIYLLNKDNYLVETEIGVDKSIEEKIKNIIDSLKKDDYVNGLKKIIPKEVELLDIVIDSNKVILNFNKEFSKIVNNKLIITGIVYSILKLKDIDKVSFQVEGKEVEGLKKEYDKNLSINPNYQYHSQNNLSKVVIYYLDDTYNNYIPVTNYLNTNKEKIEVIIEELKNNPSNLISFIPTNLELLDYKEEENVFFLNFNSSLINDNNEITNKVLNEISYSVLANYDVNMVSFQVNNTNYKYIFKE